ncbi:hypothetical protein ACFLU5_06700 [Bacteroidota bacterium]
MVINNPDICGALTWSLRYRYRNGGFYWHSEPAGMGIYKAFHWPGFSSGEAYDERKLMQMYREKAFVIQGKTVPEVSVPIKAKLLPIETVYSISWQGSMGAESYEIERAENINGPWELIASNVNDASNPYFPLYHDIDAKIGESYFYRVKAINSSGKSASSNIVGPVHVKYQALIDDMVNYGKLYASKQVKPVTGNDRSFKEILHRMEGNNESEIIYKVPGTLYQCKIYNFEKGSTDHACEIQGSSDGEIWENIETEVKVYSSGESNYDYWHPKTFTQIGKDNVKYLKILFKDEAQIARVEIIYN